MSLTSSHKSQQCTYIYVYFIHRAREVGRVSQISIAVTKW